MNPLYQNNQMMGTSHVVHLHMLSTVTAGNALLVTQSSSAIFGVYAQQNPSSINDVWNTWVWLDKGAYALHMLHGKHNSCGIMNLYVQYLPGSETLVGGSIDMYQNTATTLNFRYEQAFTMPRAGKVQISGVVAGKHASSTNYIIPIQAIIIMKVG